MVHPCVSLPARGWHDPEVNWTASLPQEPVVEGDRGGPATEG